MKDNLRLMMLSLEGLSVGDAFGQQFFNSANRKYLNARALPPGEWKWTDDTHMALSIVEMLQEQGTIDPDALIKKFAYRYLREPWRGYGWGASHLLKKIGEGGDWRTLTPKLFDGGSFGNGAAMRVAPLGAFFHHDLERVVKEARKSAMVTHAHPEGQAGAIAVALGAALAAQEQNFQASVFMSMIAEWTPESEVKEKLLLASKIAAEDFDYAVEALGTGHRVSAQDTVPFCLWMVAHQGRDFEQVLWQTVSAGGDMDTTCAIVGGLAALMGRKIPTNWLEHREPLEG